MKTIYSLLLVLLVSTVSFAQEFAIKKVEINADQVIVHYDLADTTKLRTYTVRVYASTDNFLAPLKNVSGDAGLEVKPGLNKKLIWNSKSELGVSFIGNVELEIRGRVYIPFIRLVGFEDVKDRKRTVPFLVKWTGGSSNSVLNFQLYNKDNQLVHSFPNAPNESQYQLTIPKSVKPGDGYYFRIADAKNADQLVISTPFRVKPRFPLILKAVPVLVVGGVVALLAGGSSGGGGGGDDSLENPPNVPGNPN